MLLGGVKKAPLSGSKLLPVWAQEIKKCEQGHLHGSRRPKLRLDIATLRVAASRCVCSKQSEFKTQSP